MRDPTRASSRQRHPQVLAGPQTWCLLQAVLSPLLCPPSLNQHFPARSSPGHPPVRMAGRLSCVPARPQALSPLLPSSPVQRFSPRLQLLCRHQGRWPVAPVSHAVPALALTYRRSQTNTLFKLVDNHYPHLAAPTMPDQHKPNLLEAPRLWEQTEG